jgi:hypothetical protein
VADFGRVLGEMLCAVEGPAILHIELGQLAMRCQLEAPDMQQVLIALRLLGLQARMAASGVPGRYWCGVRTLQGGLH